MCGMRTFATVALSLALAACGGKPQPGTTPAPTATEVQAEGDAADDGTTEEGDPTNPRQGPPDESRADPCGGGE